MRDGDRGALELLFFLLTFAFSWSLWIPIAVIGGEPSALLAIAIGVGAAGPSLAGLFCTGRDEGWSGVCRVLRSLLEWRMAARWYALALGGPIAVALVAVAAHRLVVGNEAEFRVETSTILLVPIGLAAGLFIGPLQEELGWRGFALPRFLDRWSSLRASLTLGAAWACWHLPLYAIDRGGQDRAPLPAFLLSVVALSVLYTWFWMITGGSLPIALLLHSATNTAAVVLLKDARSDFGPVIVATVLTVALAAVAARHLERTLPPAREERQP